MALDPSIIEAIAPVGVVAVIVSMGAWVVTTWMKVKNGYPLENSWGKPMYPNGGGEAMERIRLISQENAQLRAELGSLKDRMAVLERIATDKPSMLAAEIDGLATKQLN